MNMPTYCLPRRRKKTPTKTAVPQSEPQCLLRLPEVCRAVGLRPTAIYMLEAAGKFPRRIHLTSRSVAWDSREIARWIAQRIAERDARARRS